jgi:hypothetical protein
MSDNNSIGSIKNSALLHKYKKVQKERKVAGGKYVMEVSRWASKISDEDRFWMFEVCKKLDIHIKQTDKLMENIEIWKSDPTYGTSGPTIKMVGAPQRMRSILMGAGVSDDLSDKFTWSAFIQLFKEEVMSFRMSLYNLVPDFPTMHYSRAVYMMCDWNTNLRYAIKRLNICMSLVTKFTIMFGITLESSSLTSRKEIAEFMATKPSVVEKWLSRMNPTKDEIMNSEIDIRVDGIVYTDTHLVLGSYFPDYRKMLSQSTDTIGIDSLNLSSVVKTGLYACIFDEVYSFFGISKVVGGTKIDIKKVGFSKYDECAKKMRAICACVRSILLQGEILPPKKKGGRVAQPADKFVISAPSIEERDAFRKSIMKE